MTPTNPDLYAAVKRNAHAKFLAPTSAYKSAWIVREYKKRGGTYSGGTSPKTGLKRWFLEKWIDVATGRQCGRRTSGGKGPYPLCRPSVRVTGNTPATVHELDTAKLRKAYGLKQLARHRGRVRFSKRVPKAL